MMIPARSFALAAALLAVASTGWSQTVRSGWIVNPTAGRSVDEGLARVLPEVHSVEVADDFVIVRSAGISIHNLAPFQAPPVPVDRLRRFEFRIPLQPRPTAEAPVSVRPDVLGVFLNGQPIYNYFDAASFQGQNIWRYDLIARNDDGTTVAAGAPRPDLDHQLQIGLLRGLVGPSQKHSPILGYAFDGSPVYGPWGFANADGSGGVRRMHSSYQLRSMQTRTQWPDGTELTVGQAGPPVNAEYPLGSFVEDYLHVAGSGDLDRSNGRFGITPEYPEGVYAHFLSTDEQGRLAFPYFLGDAYHGAVSPEELDRAVADFELDDAEPDAPLFDRGAPEQSERIRFLAGPEVIAAGRPAVLSFEVLEGAGAPIRSLEFVHERPIHLLVVSEDLGRFDHIHPELRAGNRYVALHKFPVGGEYRIYADYTPPGGTQRVESFRLTVAGSDGVDEPLRESKTLSETVGPARVELQSETPLTTGRDIELVFRVRDAATGKRIPAMQPFLGAWGHFVLIAEGHDRFIHAHPQEQNLSADDRSIRHSHVHGAASETTGPPPAEIRVLTNFDKPGLYKLWAQFGLDGGVVTAPFVIRVAKGEAMVSPQTGIPAGATVIRISSTGFEPSKVTIDPAATTTLAFSRRNEPNCGSAVVFPAIGLRKDVPLGGVALVELPAGLSRELAFSCGMGMYRGAVVMADPGDGTASDGR